MSETEVESVSKSCEQSLTVFLGGAGMDGGYNEEFMKVFREAGICNPVYGNYSGLGLADGRGQIDMGADAAAVIFFNDMDILREIYHWDGAQWLYKMGPNEEHWAPLEEHPRLMRVAQNGNYSLPAIGVSKSIPRDQDTFNFVGYSWGAVIACLSARFYALAGHEVDTLALIGAPVNPSLLEWVRNMPNIKNVIVKNLTEFGDTIYAGMNDAELMQSVPDLASAMSAGANVGHFYYSGDGSAESIQRKRNLIQHLMSQGLS